MNTHLFSWRNLNDLQEAHGSLAGCRAKQTQRLHPSPEQSALVCHPRTTFSRMIFFLMELTGDPQMCMGWDTAESLHRMFLPAEKGPGICTQHLLPCAQPWHNQDLHQSLTRTFFTVEELCLLFWFGFYFILSTYIEFQNSMEMVDRNIQTRLSSHREVERQFHKQMDSEAGS